MIASATLCSRGCGEVHRSKATAAAGASSDASQAGRWSSPDARCAFRTLHHSRHNV